MGDYQYFNPLISGTGCTGTDTGMGSDAERGEECPHQQSGTRLLVPGIAVVILVAAFNLMGDALRDVLDPKEVQK